MVTWKNNDPRETYIANTGIRAVNKARKLRNTVDNPSWAMSRPESWYLNRDNLSSIKDTLAAIPAITTDQNDSRNMYQMLMNQVRGGGGARMTGVPGIIEKGKPVNVFGNFGQTGKDFYKKEFPISNFIHSAIPAATNFIPGIGTLQRFLPKKTREILPRTMVNPLRGIVPYMKPYRFMEEAVDEVSDVDLFEPYLANSQMKVKPDFDVERARKEGRAGLFELEDNLPPTIIEKIINEDPIQGEAEETTEAFTDLGDTYEFTEEMGWASGDYVDVQEYVNSIIQDPSNPYYKMDQDEFVEILIKQNRIKEK